MNMQASSKKNVFVILGMARSGTSVISRGLNALGVDLGNKLTPQSKWNPKGFWEDNDIVYKINERVLKALGSRWDAVTLTDHKKQIDGTLSEFHDLAVSLLQERFAATDYWAFKDPRTTKILPFWQSVFNTLNVKEHYVIALRNPLASALSYQRLTSTDIEHGLLLWLGHLLSAVNDTHGKERIVTSYDLMMRDPYAQLERIQNKFSIPVDPKSTENLHEYANNFLDKNLYHYECSVIDLQAHSALPVAPLCLEIYNLLNNIAIDAMTFADSEFLSAWENVQREFANVAAYYAYIDKLLDRSQQLSKSIRALHKTRFWRMTYPLRVIDNALRERRKRLKQKLAP